MSRIRLRWALAWMNPVNEVLQVTDLRKVYGSDVVAVDLVSFHVGRNEIVGLLGPNGAGKTTTINMMLGVLTPTSGSIAIDGIDIARDRRRALERTNFAAVYAALPGNLTVVQNLRVFGLFYDVSDLRTRIEQSSIDSISELCGTENAACSLPAKPRVSRWQRHSSTARPCCCSTSRQRRSIRRRPTMYASGFGGTRRKPTSASCGRRTTCMKSRRSATACCSCRAADFCSKGIRSDCRSNMATRR